MKITKSQLKTIINEILIEEQVDTSSASNIIKILQNLIGKDLKLQSSDIVKYAMILNDPKKTSSVSSARTQFIKKITDNNKDKVNADDVFYIVRAIEGLTYFSQFISSNKSKFESFIKTIFEKSEITPIVESEPVDATQETEATA